MGAISQARPFLFRSADHLQYPADTKRFLLGTGQMPHPVGGAVGVNLVMSDMVHMMYELD